MRRFFARLAISIALMLIALVAALIAIGYFMFALYLWLAVYLVPPVAAVIAGVIVLVTAARAGADRDAPCSAGVGTARSRLSPR